MNELALLKKYADLIESVSEEKQEFFFKVTGNKEDGTEVSRSYSVKADNEAEGKKKLTSYMTTAEIPLSNITITQSADGVAETTGEVNEIWGASDHAPDKISNAEAKRRHDALTRSQMPKHRVGVTVVDKDSTMVSQRSEPIQKVCRVHAGDKDEAIKRAIKFYQKRGYKVQDTNYMGVVEEQQGNK